MMTKNEFFSRRSFGFTFVELLVTVAIVAVMTAAVVYSIRGHEDTARRTKLELDVKTLNEAIRTYEINGGSMNGVTVPSAVLAKLKTVALEADKLAGLRGQLIDPRLTFEGAANLAGSPVAYWSYADKRFYVVDDGENISEGIKRFYLDEAAVPVEVQAEVRKGSFDLAVQDPWIWDKADGAAVYNSGPSTRPTPNGNVTILGPGPPTSQQLLSPIIDPPAGVYPLGEYPKTVTITDPNPPGRGSIYYSVGTGSWVHYSGPFQVNPGESVSAQVQAADTDLYLDSTVVSATFNTTPVDLTINATFAKSAYNYLELGGPVDGGNTTPPAVGGNVTLANATGEIPTEYQTSSNFKIYWTWDQSDPLTSATAIEGDNFTGGFPGQSIPVELLRFGAQTIEVKIVARSLNSSYFNSSPVTSIELNIEKLTLPPPILTYDGTAVTMAVAGSNLPTGHFVQYTLDGTNPGNNNGAPTAGLRYVAPVPPPGVGLVEIHSRTYPAESGRLFWNPSPESILGLGITLTGNYYAVTGTDHYLYQFDPVTGDNIIKSSTPTWPMAAVAADTSSHFVYVVEQAAGNWHLGRYDLQNNEFQEMNSLQQADWIYTPSSQPTNLTLLNNALYFIPNGTDDLVKVELSGNAADPSVVQVYKVADLSGDAISFARVGDLVVNPSGILTFSAEDRFASFDLKNLSNFQVLQSSLPQAQWWEGLVYNSLGAGDLYGTSAADPSQVSRVNPTTAVGSSPQTTSPTRNFIDYGGPQPVVPMQQVGSHYFVMEGRPILYRLDIATGRHYVVTASLPTLPTSVALDNEKSLIYFTGTDAARPGQIILTRYNLATGVFTEMGDLASNAFAFSAISAPQGLTFFESALYYIAPNSDDLIKLTLDAYAVTAQEKAADITGDTEIFEEPASMAIGPDGQLYFSLADRDLFATYDIENLSDYLIISALPNSSWQSLTFTTAGQMHGTSTTDLDTLQAITAATGAVTGSTDLVPQDGTQVFDITGPFNAGAPPGSDDYFAITSLINRIYRFNPTNGTNSVLTSALPWMPCSLAFDPATLNLYYLRNTNTPADWTLGRFTIGGGHLTLTGSLSQPGLSYTTSARPNNLAFFAGNLWFIAPNTDDLVMVTLDPTGTSIQDVLKVADITNDSTTFTSPSDLTVKAGKLYFGHSAGLSSYDLTVFGNHQIVSASLNTTRALLFDSAGAFYGTTSINSTYVRRYNEVSGVELGNVNTSPARSFTDFAGGEPDVLLPSGALYAVTGAERNVYRFLPATGYTVTLTNATLFPAASLAYDAAGQHLYYVENVTNNFRLGRSKRDGSDQVSLGDLTAPGLYTYVPSARPDNLVFFSGSLWYIAPNSDDLIKVDLDGTTILDQLKVADINGNRPFPSVGDMTVAPSGLLHFSAPGKLCQFDLTTLSGYAELPAVSNAFYRGLLFDSGHLLGVSQNNPTRFYRINTTTAAETAGVTTQPSRIFVDFAAEEPNPTLPPTGHVLWTIVTKGGGAQLVSIRNYRYPTAVATEFGPLAYQNGAATVPFPNAAPINALTITQSGTAYFVYNAPLTIGGITYTRPLFQVSTAPPASPPVATVVGDLRKVIERLDASISATEAVSGLAFNPVDGTLYVAWRDDSASTLDKIARVNLLSVDHATRNFNAYGLLGLLSGQGQSINVLQDISFAPDGTLYASDSATGKVFKLSPSTGEILSVHSVEAGAGLHGLAVLPADGDLVASNAASGTYANSFVKVVAGAANDRVYHNYQTKWNYLGIENIAFASYSEGSRPGREQSLWALTEDNTTRLTEFMNYRNTSAAQVMAVDWGELFYLPSAGTPVAFGSGAKLSALAITDAGLALFVSNRPLTNGTRTLHRPLFALDIGTLALGTPPVATIVGDLDAAISAVRGGSFDENSDFITGLTISPLGQLLFVVKTGDAATPDHLARLNSLDQVGGGDLYNATNLGTLQGVGELSGSTEDLAYSNSGTLYVTDAADGDVYAINPATAAITSEFSTSAGAQFVGAAVDPLDQELILSSSPTSTPSNTMIRSEMGAANDQTLFDFGVHFGLHDVEAINFYGNALTALNPSYFAVRTGVNSIFMFDPETGHEQILTNGCLFEPVTLAFDASNATLYYVENLNFNYRLAKFDITTRTHTMLGNMTNSNWAYTAGQLSQNLAYFDGNLYFIATNTDDLVKVELGPNSIINMLKVADLNANTSLGLVHDLTVSHAGLLTFSRPGKLATFNLATPSSLVEINTLDSTTYRGLAFTSAGDLLGIGSAAPSVIHKINPSTGNVVPLGTVAAGQTFVDFAAPERSANAPGEGRSLWAIAKGPSNHQLIEFLNYDQVSAARIIHGDIRYQEGATIRHFPSTLQIHAMTITDAGLVYFAVSGNVTHGGRTKAYSLWTLPLASVGSGTPPTATFVGWLTTAMNTAKGSIATPPADFLSGLAIRPGTNEIYGTAAIGGAGTPDVLFKITSSAKDPFDQLSGVVRTRVFNGTPSLTNVKGLAFDGSDNLFVADADGNEVYTVNPATGAVISAHSIQTSIFTTAYCDLASDPVSGMLVGVAPFSTPGNIMAQITAGNENDVMLFEFGAPPMSLGEINAIAFPSFPVQLPPSAYFATIGNMIYLDANLNGKADPGEGVDNVAVQALDESGHLLGTQSTSNGGRFLFTGLRATGLKIKVPPSNFSAGSPLAQATSIVGAGGDDNVDSDDNGVDSSNPTVSGVTTSLIDISSHATTYAYSWPPNLTAATDDAGGAIKGVYLTQDVATQILNGVVRVDNSTKDTKALWMCVNFGSGQDANWAAFYLANGTLKATPYNQNPTTTHTIGPIIYTAPYSVAVSGTDKIFTFSVNVNSINNWSSAPAGWRGAGFPFDRLGNNDGGTDRIAISLRTFADNSLTTTPASSGWNRWTVTGGAVGQFIDQRAVDGPAADLSVDLGFVGGSSAVYYATSKNAKGIYRVNVATGNTSLATTTTLNWTLAGVAYDHENGRVYYLEDTGNANFRLGRYDLETGTHHNLGSLAQGWLASRPSSQAENLAFFNGNLWYVQNGTDDLFCVFLDPNGSIKQQAKIADMSADTVSLMNVGDLTVGPDGVLYIAAQNMIASFDLLGLNSWTVISNAPGATWRGLLVHYDGKLYGMKAEDQTSIYEISTADGTATLTAATSPLQAFHDLDGHPGSGRVELNGDVYATSEDVPAVYRVNLETGSQSIVRFVSQNLASITQDLDANCLYVLANTNPLNTLPKHLLRINLTTWEETDLGVFTTGRLPGHLAAFCGKLYYIAPNSDDLMRVDFNASGTAIAGFTKIGDVSANARSFTSVEAFAIDNNGLAWISAASPNVLATFSMPSLLGYTEKPGNGTHVFPALSFRSSGGVVGNHTTPNSDRSKLFNVDAATGASALHASIAGNVKLSDMANNSVCPGALTAPYFGVDGTKKIYRFDPATGVTEVLTEAPFATDTLAFDAATQVLYYVEATDTDYRLGKYSLNSDTHANMGNMEAAAFSGIASPTHPRHLACYQGALFYVVNGTDRLVRIRLDATSIIGMDAWGSMHDSSGNLTSEAATVDNNGMLWLSTSNRLMRYNLGIRGDLTEIDNTFPQQLGLLFHASGALYGIPSASPTRLHLVNPADGTTTPWVYSVPAVNFTDIAAGNTAPAPPAVNSDLLVTSNSTDSVAKYDRATQTFVPFIPTGSGGLNRPYDLVVAPDRTLLVTSSFNNAILRYHLSTGASLGALVASGGGGLLDPRGLAIGPDGNVYVISHPDVPNGTMVKRFDSATGAYLGDFVTGINLGRQGLAFGPDGHLYVAERGSSSVVKFHGITGANLGVVADAADGLDNLLRDLDFGPDGMLYVNNEGNKIWRINPSTGATTLWSSVNVTPGMIGSGFSFGSDGQLYLGDLDRSRILQLDGSTGAFIRLAGQKGALDAPKDILAYPTTGFPATPTENYFVVSGGRQIYRIDPSNGSAALLTTAPYNVATIAYDQAGGAIYYIASDDTTISLGRYSFASQAHATLGDLRVAGPERSTVHPKNLVVAGGVLFYIKDDTDDLIRIELTATGINRQVKQADLAGGVSLGVVTAAVLDNSGLMYFSTNSALRSYHLTNGGAVTTIANGGATFEGLLRHASGSFFGITSTAKDRLSTVSMADGSVATGSYLFPQIWASDLASGNTATPPVGSSRSLWAITRTGTHGELVEFTNYDQPSRSVRNFNDIAYNNGGTATLFPSAVSFHGLAISDSGRAYLAVNGPVTVGAETHDYSLWTADFNRIAVGTQVVFDFVGWLDQSLDGLKSGTASPGAGDYVKALTVKPGTGELFGILEVGDSLTADTLFRIGHLGKTSSNMLTGIARIITWNSGTVISNASGLTFNADGSVLYVADVQGNEIFLLSPTTGAVTSSAFSIQVESEAYTDLALNLDNSDLVGTSPAGSGIARILPGTGNDIALFNYMAAPMNLGRADAIAFFSHPVQLSSVVPGQAYAVSGADNSIYRFDGSAGWTSVFNSAALFPMEAVAVNEAENRIFYIEKAAANWRLGEYRVSAGTHVDHGPLTQPGLGYTPTAQPRNLAYLNGKLLYVAENTDDLVAIEFETSGGLAMRAQEKLADLNNDTPLTNLGDIAADGTGRIYISASNAWAQWDFKTQSGFVIGNAAPAQVWAGLIATSSGQVFGVSAAEPTKIYAVNPATGVGTFQADFSPAENFIDLAIPHQPVSLNLSGQHYAVTGSNPSLYRVNITNGRTYKVASQLPVQNPMAIAANKAASCLFVVGSHPTLPGQILLSKIDLSTQVASIVGNLADPSLGYQPATIPRNLVYFHGQLYYMARNTDDLIQITLNESHTAITTQTKVADIGGVQDWDAFTIGPDGLAYISASNVHLLARFDLSSLSGFLVIKNSAGTDEGANYQALTFDASGQMHGVLAHVNQKLYRVDAASGATTFLADSNPALSLIDLTGPYDVGPSLSTPYYAANRTATIFTVHPYTLSTYALNSGASFNIDSVAHDKANNLLFYVENSDSQMRLGRYNLANATHTVLGSLNASSLAYRPTAHPEHLACHNGALYYIAPGTDDLVRVVVTASAISSATKVADLNGGQSFGSVQAAAVDDSGVMFFSNSTSLYRFDLSAMGDFRIVNATFPSYVGLMWHADSGHLVGAPAAAPSNLDRVLRTNGSITALGAATPSVAFSDFARGNDAPATVAGKYYAADGTTTLYQVDPITKATSTLPVAAPFPVAAVALDKHNEMLYFIEANSAGATYRVGRMKLADGTIETLGNAKASTLAHVASSQPEHLLHYAGDLYYIDYGAGAADRDDLVRLRISQGTLSSAVKIADIRANSNMNKITAAAIDNSGTLYMSGGTSFYTYNIVTRSSFIAVTSSSTALSGLVWTGGTSLYGSLAANPNQIASVTTDGVVGSGVGTSPSVGLRDMCNGSTPPAPAGHDLPKAYIAGDFSFAGTARNLARINPDGSRDATFNIGSGFNGKVHALQRDSNALFVAGEFNDANGVWRTGLAKVSTSGAIDSSYNPVILKGNLSTIFNWDGWGGFVQNMVVGDGTTDMSARNAYFGLSSATGGVTGWPSQVWNNVSGSGVNVTLYVSPNMTETDGTHEGPDLYGNTGWHTGGVNPDRRITGHTALRVTPDVAGVVHPATVVLSFSQAVYLDQVLIGSLSKVSGKFENSYVRAFTTADATGAPVVADSYANISDRVAVLLGDAADPITTVDSGNVLVDASPGDGIYQTIGVGDEAEGRYGRVALTYASTPVRSLALTMWMTSETSGGVPTFSAPLISGAGATTLSMVSFAPASNPGKVYALAQQPDGKLLIAGDFTQVNGQARKNVARLNSNGSLDVTFDPGVGANQPIRSLALHSDGRVAVGGAFTTWSGAAANYVTLLTPSGAKDAGWTNSTTLSQAVGNSVQTLEFDSLNRLYVGGRFTAPEANLARLTLTGANDATFNPSTGASNTVNSLLFQNDGLIIGGAFTSFNGSARNRIAKVDYTGLNVATWNPGTGFDAAVNAIAQLSGTNYLHAAGAFSSFNGAANPRNKAAAVHATSGAATANPWGPVELTITEITTIK